MTATTLRKLTKEEWEEVRSLSRTVTGYDSTSSPIKGQTTVQIVQTIAANIKEQIDETGMTVALGEARDLAELLTRREAYNTFIGVESKKRRKN